MLKFIVFRRFYVKYNTKITIIPIYSYLVQFDYCRIEILNLLEVRNKYKVSNIL